MAVGPPRKPIRAEGVAIPELMAQLGVSSWTNVPNAILERWMGPDYPPKLRVLAALVRHSFGYQSPHAVHLVKGQPRPLRQVDLARLLGLEKRWLKRILAEARCDGLVTVDRKLVYPVATPSVASPVRQKRKMGVKLTPFASPSPLPPAHDALADPEYLTEVTEIKADYKREIGLAKGRLVQRLQIAQARALQRGKGVDLTPQLGVDLTPNQGPYKRKESEKKGQAGGQYVQVEAAEASLPASPPAFPSLEVQELARYLEQFTHLVGEAPPLAEVEEIHQRLLPATIGQFRTHVDNRLARGFRPHGWRVLRQLAADCAASKEAVDAAPPADASAPTERRAKLARLQRALGPKP